jgi:hypothetical protein
VLGRVVAAFYLWLTSQLADLLRRIALLEQVSMAYLAWVLAGVALKLADTQRLLRTHRRVSARDVCGTRAPIAHPLEDYFARP